MYKLQLKAWSNYGKWQTLYFCCSNRHYLLHDPFKKLRPAENFRGELAISGGGEFPPPGNMPGWNTGGASWAPPAGSGQSPGHQRIFGIFEAHRTLLVERTVSTKPVFFREKIHSVDDWGEEPPLTTPLKKTMSFVIIELCTWRPWRQVQRLKIRPYVLKFLSVFICPDGRYWERWSLTSTGRVVEMLEWP